MRTYADISHFRAPYKNWPSLSGMGAVQAAQDSPLPIVGQTNGVAEFTPAVADLILKAMPSYSIVHIDDNNVKLEPAVPKDVRETAAAWISRHSGSTIVAGTTGGAQYFLSGGMPVERYLTAVKPTREAEIAATAGGLGAVLKRPAGLFAKLGPVGVAAVALVALGAVVLVMKKKRSY